MGHEGSRGNREGPTPHRRGRPLPPDLLNRRKSIYPGAADEAYGRAIDAQLRALLRQPSAPLFNLIDHGRLAEASRATRA